MYKMVIEPTMIYGLKTPALTKGKKEKKYEIKKVRENDTEYDRYVSSRNKPHKRKIHGILDRKEIIKLIKHLRICYFSHVH